jgi:hypothetical protein
MYRTQTSPASAFSPQRLSVTTATPLHKSPLRVKSQLKTPTHFEHFSGYFRSITWDVLSVFLTWKNATYTCRYCPPSACLSHLAYIYYERTVATKWLLRMRVVPTSWGRYCVNSKWLLVIMLNTTSRMCILMFSSYRTVNTVLVIETNRFVLYREIMIDGYEIFKKHRTTMGREWNNCTLHLVVWAG